MLFAAKIYLKISTFFPAKLIKEHHATHRFFHLVCAPLCLDHLVFMKCLWSVCRGYHGDAEPGSEENLPLPADGRGPDGNPVFSNPTVQAPLRAHKERQVSHDISLRLEG